MWLHGVPQHPRQITSECLLADLVGRDLTLLSSRCAYNLTEPSPSLRSCQEGCHRYMTGARGAVSQGPVSSVECSSRSLSFQFLAPMRRSLSDRRVSDVPLLSVGNRRQAVESVASSAIVSSATSLRVQHLAAVPFAPGGLCCLQTPFRGIQSEKGRRLKLGNGPEPFLGTHRKWL